MADNNYTDADEFYRRVIAKQEELGEEAARNRKMYGKTVNYTFVRNSKNAKKPIRGRSGVAETRKAADAAVSAEKAAEEAKKLADKKAAAKAAKKKTTSRKPSTGGGRKKATDAGLQTRKATDEQLAVARGRQARLIPNTNPYAPPIDPTQWPQINNEESQETQTFKREDGDDGLPKFTQIDGD